MSNTDSESDVNNTVTGLIISDGSLSRRPLQKEALERKERVTIKASNLTRYSVHAIVYTRKLYCLLMFANLYICKYYDVTPLAQRDTFYQVCIISSRCLHCIATIDKTIMI